MSVYETPPAWLPGPRGVASRAPLAVGGVVVVADDDPTLRELVTFQLTRAGATVLQAADGAEALALCHEPGVELAVLDIEMPQLTGFDVLEALKADPATENLPILLLTAHAMVGGAVKGIKLGAHDYVRKPFDLGELQARVDAAILLGRRTRELALSEKRYRTLLNLLPGTAVLVLDADLRIVSAGGTAVAERYGSGPSSEGLLLAEVTAPEDYQAVGPYFTRVLAGEGGGLFPVTSVTGQHWLVDATLIAADDGSPQVLAMIRDATELMRTQHDLRLAEERFHGAFDDAPVGIVITDLDGSWLQINEAFARITGYPVEELAHMSRHDLLVPEDVVEQPDFMGGVGSDQAGEGQARIRHADGHLVWVTANVAALRDEDGVHVANIYHIEDVTDRKRFEAQLAHLADHDPLTGLLNRRGFEVELDRQAAHVARYGPSGALLVLDLDHFKQINDTLGHNAGDELVAAMGELLRRTVRETDIVARLGGDEFAVILPMAERDEAEAAARKIVEAVRARVTRLAGSQQRTVTVSVGIAMFDDPELSGEAVLVNADLTMYDAKEAGRDRYAFHSTSLNTQPQTKARLAWVDRLNLALEQDRFELYAQAVLDLESGRVNRHELLLRMVDDNGGVVLPSEFLAIAERFGLVGRIDRWVVSQAIDLLADTRLPATTALEVNLSGLSVGDGQLLTFLEERLAGSGVDPSRLIFEITETAAVGNMQAARVFAERLASIGCRFALDDFGAGFGSFYYLKHLPFDFIKIDGEFIAKCLTDDTDRLVIQALVSVARGLGKRTIAEFVGDEETLRFVTDEGVDFAQGHHIGRPRPVAELLQG